MARKQLIKGANALRVEERIARVPADLLAESREGGAGQESIFRALKALETEPKPAASTGAKQRRVKEAKRPKAEIAAPRRIGPTDFSAAERAAIVRSCTEYRNFLPTYLLSAQAEIKVIDAVLAKCRAAERKS